MGRKIHDSWMSLDFYVLIFTHKKPPKEAFSIDIIHLL